MCLHVSLCSMYTLICSHDQRQSYKQDFNKEYDEYRDLHARIDGVTRQFMELDTQLKQLNQESHKYKVISLSLSSGVAAFTVTGSCPKIPSRLTIYNTLCSLLFLPVSLLSPPLLSLKEWK